MTLSLLCFIFHLCFSHSSLYVISKRVHIKVIRLVRMIADLHGDEMITDEAVFEALRLRKVPALTCQALHLTFIMEVLLVGRRPRVEIKGGVYHVIQRGNNREYIFRKSKDKKYLLELVKDYKEVSNFDLLGFVIMDNHYHMIVKPLNARLQDIMHRINNKYSKYYNRQNERTGHVFENRYKSIFVNDQNYLLSLLRYVHQNPIKAKMCERVKDYPWSSDVFYRRNRLGGLVDIDFILNRYSRDRGEAIKAYQKFMDADKLEEEGMFERVSVIGANETSQKYVQPILEKQSLDDILIEVTKDKAIYEAIKSGSRKRILSDYKQEYIKRALAVKYTMKEIGEHISISEVAVYNLSQVPGT